MWTSVTPLILLVQAACSEPNMTPAITQLAAPTVAHGEPTQESPLTVTIIPSAAMTPTLTPMPPVFQSRDNTVTSQLPDPGGHIRANAGAGYPGPDAGSGDPDTRTDASIDADDNPIYTGVHARYTQGNTDQDAGDTRPDTEKHSKSPRT